MLKSILLIAAAFMFVGCSHQGAPVIPEPPAENPVLSIVVCVDEPRPVYYGGEVAAPVFKNVAGESLKYLNAKGAT